MTVTLIPIIRPTTTSKNECIPKYILLKLTNKINKKVAVYSIIIKGLLTVTTGLINVKKKNRILRARTHEFAEWVLGHPNS